MSLPRIDLCAGAESLSWSWLSAEGSEGEGDKSRAAAAASSAYFQNPAGNLPVHSNPFATFQEVSPHMHAQCLVPCGPICMRAPVHEVVQPTSTESPFVNGR